MPFYKTTNDTGAALYLYEANLLQCHSQARRQQYKPPAAVRTCYKANGVSEVNSRHTERTPNTFLRQITINCNERQIENPWLTKQRLHARSTAYGLRISFGQKKQAPVFIHRLMSFIRHDKQQTSTTI
jgi:hypothetical protein